MLSMTKPLIEISQLVKSFDDQVVLNSINLSVKDGEFLTLLGPSGCGKTTLLRLISGFDTPDQGTINISGSCINHLPPQQRNVHTVFQSYALFPHLDVFNNVAFSLYCQKTPADEVTERVNEALRLVQLPHLTHRPIRQLSGGQQQRVAIARAIVNRPQVLLLDEPLSSLDYQLRKSMQYELKQLQKKLGMTFIFVTHDQEEALSMSDRIVVLNEGQIEQIGTPREVYETPQNLFVAKFIGEANIFDVTVTARSDKKHQVQVENETIHCISEKIYPEGTRLFLIIRPEDIRVWTQKEIDNPEGMIAGKIKDIVYKGSTVDLKVTLPSGAVINASEFFDEDDEDLEYTLNESVWVHWLPGWEVLLPHAT